MHRLQAHPEAQVAETPAAWQARVLGHLQSFQHYPPEAVTLGQVGVVDLRLTMNREGKVLSGLITRSSGFPALDQEALALLDRAQPLPAPPPEITGDPLEIILPVQFNIK